MFSTHGVPSTLVSDNGPAFTSEEFQEFCESISIRHVQVAPYHPSSNRLAERAVRTVKQALAHRRRGTPLSDHLASFLLSYRITPHPTTGYMPSELLMGRRLRTRLDLLFPNVVRHAELQQQKQKLSHDKSVRGRPAFPAGETVFARDYSRLNSSHWTKGIITEQTGPVSYRVRVDGGSVRPVHQDQLRQGLFDGTPVEGSSEEGQEQEEEAGLPVHEEAGQPVCDGLLEEGGEVMGSTAVDKDSHVLDQGPEVT